MNYCSIEEAWGDELVKEKKKKKKSEKTLYRSQIPEYIEDSSYEDGIHNTHCSRSFSNKRHQAHVKKPKKGRKIKTKKSGNVRISYENAMNEYNNYKNETKNIKKNNKKNKNNIPGEYLSPSMYNGLSDEELYQEYTEDEMSINNIDTVDNNSDMDYSQIQYTGMEDEDYLKTQQYSMDFIEGFESNGDELDAKELVKKGNDKVKDVKPSKKVRNLMDKLLEESKGSNSSEEQNSSDEQQLSENQQSDDNSENSDIESTDDEQPELPKNNKVKVSKRDIDYRLNALNRSMNMIIKQMNKSQFFDDESQDNIHDLILFILFGIFIIFILDSIYKLGKNSSTSVGY
tara:strand:- start:518 stop:1549 length:1032 start_codon:yes stop_codon:yes gene_type:complete